MRAVFISWVSSHSFVPAHPAKSKIKVQPSTKYSEDPGLDHVAKLLGGSILKFFHLWVFGSLHVTEGRGVSYLLTYLQYCTGECLSWNFFFLFFRKPFLILSENIFFLCTFMLPTRNSAHNLGICLDWEWNHDLLVHRLMLNH
uniref:Uncharacterized protein n=1 Tax=Pipistrellus kuhlii TaxID=59472 RepID=A0A7J7X058_PIPKU|nr:hypothetical protein mPipKuh1_010778 [Pipistrellus kuhlii]